MSFLRRLLRGGGERAPTDAQRPSEAHEAREADVDPIEDEAAERAAELEVLRAEDERLDEFRRRQVRFAKWAWRPPAQGGPRRADDGESPGEGSASDDSD